MSRKSTKAVWTRLIILALIIVGVVLLFNANRIYAPQKNQYQPPTFNKNEHAIDEASSIWVVVNKGRVLPSAYVPPDLTAPNVATRLPGSDPEMKVRQEVASDLESMFVDAAKDNIKLMVSSAFRSYQSQKSLYQGYVAKDGQTAADVSSARPGHSEHQTGLAVDVEPASRKCEIDVCFAETPEGKWVAENSYKYGFIIRYQAGTQDITGYEYEPWHLRYVGKELANEINKQNQTLEQFFGLPTYSDYIEAPLQLKL